MEFKAIRLERSCNKIRPLKMISNDGKIEFGCVKGIQLFKKSIFRLNADLTNMKRKQIRNAYA